jgi:hypothetical protein
VDIIVIANAAGWKKYYDPLVFEDGLDRACASTLGTNLYVTGTGLMATDSQVTLNPSPDDDHPSLQHWYESIEQSKTKIFPAANYLTKREIPTHFIPTEKDTP